MFRLDRFLTLHVFRHLLKVLPQPKGVRIPILMYHSISDEPETGHPYYWINTSPRRFAEHMKFLADNNYKVISLCEAVRIIEANGSNSSNIPATHHSNGSIPPFQYSNTPEFEYPIPSSLLPDKCVVLTFDDGYLDFYTDAFPVLRKFCFTATVFLPTSFIGNGKPGLVGKKHLGWHQVRELEQHGINFGSHTVNHIQLWKADRNAVQSELWDSKAMIERQTGKVVETFCYPYWFPEQDRAFVARIKEVLTESGYLCSTGTRIGTTHRSEEGMIFKRVPVNSGDDIHFFSAKLSGRYDWVQRIQRVYKKTKALSGLLGSLSYSCLLGS